MEGDHPYRRCQPTNQAANQKANMPACPMYYMLLGSLAIFGCQPIYYIGSTGTGTGLAMAAETGRQRFAVMPTQTFHSHIHIFMSVHYHIHIHIHSLVNTYRDSGTAAMLVGKKDGSSSAASHSNSVLGQWEIVTHCPAWLLCCARGG